MIWNKFFNDEIIPIWRVVIDELQTPVNVSIPEDGSIDLELEWESSSVENLSVSPLVRQTGLSITVLPA